MEDRYVNYMKKVSESIANVMEYIKFSEMGGEVDGTDPYYPCYTTLRELLWKVKDEEEMEEILDETAHPDTLDGKKWDNADFDVDMSRELWDN